ncbi:NUZM, NADH-ubiquinone oxidoreductase 21.3 kDa subunit [Tricholoma matsutake]|nr:NUZM, NADH-ubiquinone oxidoreductase 21.3 kDa subunit [Tricholoma matsutake 945]
MATKKVAESTLYHLSPQGFWKKFRDAVVINPEISTGLPLATINRRPQPASRPEKYSTPATKASDPAQNPYWKRDIRRAYPQLSVITQAELSSLLIEHSGTQTIPQPSQSKENASDISATLQGTVDLTEAIASITTAQKVYSESKLPPTIPVPHKHWTPKLAPDAPHDQHAYFPMSLYK